MPGFKQSDLGTTGCLLWIGDPGDEQAHQAILAWLRSARVDFLAPGTPLSNRIKGNLGEFIAYCIGRHNVHPPDVSAYGENTYNPLGDISNSGLDIKWLNLGPTPATDWMIIQEVKTTGSSSLSIADDLIADYDKLFGQNLKFTLRTRLNQFKTKLEQEGRHEFVPRITELGGPRANQARGIYLFPTLLHSASLNSTTKMSAVRQAIVGLGWPSQTVECWSIQLDDIDTRLTQISRGQ